MKAAQLWVVVAGVGLAAALFFLRNIPEQTNALDALLQSRVDSLSSSQATTWQTLQSDWSGDFTDPQLDTLIGFWVAQNEPAVAAALALQRYQSTDSEAHQREAAALALEAVKTGRQGEAQGVNDNLLFFFTEQSGELYGQLVAQDSTDLEARMGLAATFIDGKGQIMPGVQELLGILEVDSLYVPANLRLGRLSMINGEYANVVKRMQKVLQADSTMGEAYVTLASAYRAMGEEEKARSYLAQSLPYLDNGPLREEVEKRLQEL